jgi:hypothetical protein
MVMEILFMAAIVLLLSGIELASWFSVRYHTGNIYGLIDTDAFHPYKFHVYLAFAQHPTSWLHCPTGNYHTGLGIDN